MPNSWHSLALWPDTELLLPSQSSCGSSTLQMFPSLPHSHTQREWRDFTRRPHCPETNVDLFCTSYHLSWEMYFVKSKKKDKMNKKITELWFDKLDSMLWIKQENSCAWPVRLGEVFSLRPPLQSWWACLWAVFNTEVHRKQRATSHMSTPLLPEQNWRN